MEKVITKFDEILNGKQDRDQKRFTFTILFTFFTLETIALFVIIFLKGFGQLSGLDNGILQIIIGATITQVATMITFVVIHLYPSNKESLDSIKSIQENISKLTNLDKTQKSD